MNTIQALNDCIIGTLTERWGGWGAGEGRNFSYSSLDIYVAMNNHVFAAALFAWILPNTLTESTSF